MTSPSPSSRRAWLLPVPPATSISSEPYWLNGRPWMSPSLRAATMSNPCASSNRPWRPPPAAIISTCSHTCSRTDSNPTMPPLGPRLTRLRSARWSCSSTTAGTSIGPSAKADRRRYRKTLLSSRLPRPPSQPEHSLSRPSTKIYSKEILAPVIPAEAALTAFATEHVGEPSARTTKR